MAHAQTMRTLGHLPARFAWTVGGWAAQTAYLLWPAKRRYVNANFAHVLGTRPDDPEVARLARSAYRNYARYLVEVMRLPSRRPEYIANLVDQAGLVDLDADQQVRNPFAAGANERPYLKGTVFVWSLGPDGDANTSLDTQTGVNKDNIYSWK